MRRSAFPGTADPPPAHRRYRAGNPAKGLVEASPPEVDDFTQQQQAFGPEVGSPGHESDTDVWQVCSLPAKQLLSAALKRTWERLL
jgi:hypothetical protein